MHVETIDLHFQNTPHSIASFLVTAPDGQSILIETGPSSSTEMLVGALLDRGIRPSDIRHVLLSHIHFDHAGAAGWWAQQGAVVYVHHRGAPHLADPAKLIASATRIYGDQMDSLWGPILAVPTDRLIALSDGDAVEIGGLRFEAMDTPGHARHHMVFRLGEIAFAGDAAGIRIPGNQWIDLPAPPPEFDLEVWLGTLERLGRESFSRLYLTHFGPTDEVDIQLGGLRQQLHRSVAQIAGWLDRGLDRDTIVAEHHSWITDCMESSGVDLAAAAQYRTANPPTMSVDGILRYLTRK